MLATNQLSVKSSCATFDIRNHLDQLTEDGGSAGRHETSYHCPNCEAPNFKVDHRTGRYGSYSCNCATTEEGKRKIRNAVAPQRTEKTYNPKQKRHWTYTDTNGKPLIRTVRLDNGESKKKIWQEYCVNGQWLTPSRAEEKGIELDKTAYYNQVALLYYNEVKRAIAQEETIFIVEGEPVADVLRKLGLTATTNIMGSGSWKEDYTDQLKGAKQVVIGPDRDTVGIKHAEAIATSLEGAGIHPQWLYAYPNSNLWHRLENSNGLDLKDYLEDYPSMSADDLFNLIELHRRKFELAYESDNGSSDHSDDADQDQFPDIKQEIDRILESNLTGSDLKIALTNLAQAAKQPFKQIISIYNERYDEFQNAEELEERREELAEILNNKKADIDIATIFPAPLAKAIKQMAKWLAVRPVTFATALLCGVSALHHTDSKVWLNQSWGFSVTPNLFGAIVAESSQKKSPILNSMVTKPLMTLQKQWEVQYQEEMAAYRQQLQEWKDNNCEGEEPKEPRQRLAYFSHATSEGLAVQATKTPDQGMMYLRDELAGLFNQLNKYGNGKGSELEDLLSFYDGTGGCNLRVGGASANFYGVLVSLFGTVQPEVLRKLMGNMDDDNGLWGRFLMVYQPLAQSVMEDDAGGVNLDDLIYSIYRDIHDKKSAEDYTLSREAFQLFRDAYNHYEQLRTAYNTKPALRAMYGKAEGRIGKIAVNLHAIKCAMANEEDNHVIDAETMQSAIALNNFYISQILAIHGELDDEAGLSGLLAKIVQIAEKANKPIRASDVIQALPKRERKPAAEIKEQFYELERLGYGVTSGTNRSLKFSLTSKDKTAKQQTPNSDPPQPNSEPKCGQFGQSLDKATKPKTPITKEKEETFGQFGYTQSPSLPKENPSESKHEKCLDKDQEFHQTYPNLPNNSLNLHSEGNTSLDDSDQTMTKQQVNDAEADQTQINEVEEKEIDWVRIDGEVFRVAAKAGNTLYLRESGFSKVVRKVQIHEVEIGGYKQ